MEEVQRSSPSENVPVDLIHRIQSMLPVEEAARTCVLSKTWSHAWSTIPHLRFHLTSEFANEEKERDYIKFMDRTMSKYAQHNIPIESLKLKLNNKLASHLANKRIPTVAAQSCLKELSIRIESDSDLILPDEIFFGKNLHTLSLSDIRLSPIETVSRNPVINCVNLRVLELLYVEISEEVLDTLFSNCVLLEKIDLTFRSDMKTFKVRNFRYLQELKLRTQVPLDVLKIDDVPNLCLFLYDVFSESIKTFNMASLMSVTKLSLHGVTIDVHFLDMIKLKLPSLEILDLVIRDWTSERWDFTRSSLKCLTLITRVSKKIDIIQVNAPNLRHLSYRGRTMPSILFPSSNVPEYIKLELDLFRSDDPSFFLTMRDLLNLSTKFDIEISYFGYELPNIDNEDREIWFTVPSTNVQHLSYNAYLTENLQGHLSYFDALVTLCHPKYVTLYSRNPIFSVEIKSPEKFFCDFFKPIISRMMANKTSDRKDIEFKNPGNGKWEILTDSFTSTILDISAYSFYSVELKPNCNFFPYLLGYGRRIELLGV
ncbi:putative F-box/FBD/LRR-repeat protein At4g13965 [Rutidosis leptorrhynchoides]|uniref:putative F-box/FBD/LRR-repeat protein At4g13965 n=1 Tax=Rutidosis leptorrhynchoides TaxID=125765 RepID=UPI003A9A3337